MMMEMPSATGQLIPEADGIFAAIQPYNGC